MIVRISQRHRRLSSDFLTSKLLNQDTFYPTLLKDMDGCRGELVIESPFITTRRVNQLLPTFRKLKAHNVRIIVNTRDPQTNEEEYQRVNAFEAITKLQGLGIEVFYTGGHHRKLVIVDRAVLYEGSLNPLSQNDSCEIMRRIESVRLAQEMIQFVGVDSYAL